MSIKYAIDGKKFLDYFGLSEDDDITPELICEKLSSLSEEELKDFCNKVDLSYEINDFDGDTINRFNLDAAIDKLNNVFAIYDDIYLDPVSSAKKQAELKKSIKYCKNPMIRSKLERELSELKFQSSKHKKSKKRRK